VYLAVINEGSSVLDENSSSTVATDCEIAKQCCCHGCLNHNITHKNSCGQATFEGDIIEWGHILCDGSDHSGGEG